MGQQDKRMARKLPIAASWPGVAKGPGARPLPAKIRRHQPARGQALVLFALLLIPVLGLVGFAIDGLRTYIAEAQAERAAEAAALAGAIYLPNYPTPATPAPDGEDATTRALAEAAKNGFTTASDIKVVASSWNVGTNSAPPTLTVSVHYHVTLTLAGELNPAPLASVATATAEVVPPMTLFTGSNPTTLRSISSGMAPVLVGPAGQFALGDPYSVWCVSALQCSPGSPGNPNKIPNNYEGLATREPFSAVPTGVSYLITLPPGTQNQAVWIRSADDNYSLNALAFSLYSVPQLWNRLADLPIAAVWPYASPPVTTPAPALIGSQIIPTSTLPANSSTWVRLPATLSAPSTGPAFFRLTVEDVAGTGFTPYSARVCQDTTTGPNCGTSNVVFGAWNFATQALYANGTYGLLTLPAAYAGRQIALQIFEPALGGTTFNLYAPAATSPTATFAIPTNPGAIWLSYTLTLPPDYAGGTWNIAVTMPFEPTPVIFTIDATLLGPPVTLLG